MFLNKCMGGLDAYSGQSVPKESSYCENMWSTLMVADEWTTRLLIHLAVIH